MSESRTQRRLLAKALKKNGVDPKDAMQQARGIMGGPLDQTLTELRDLTSKLPAIEGIVKNLEGLAPLPQIIDHLDETRQALALILERQDAIEYELRKQRAVNIATTLTSSAGQPRTEDDLMSYENQKRAEFDAIQALTFLIHREP